jgi:hypothetical protein
MHVKDYITARDTQDRSSGGLLRSFNHSRRIRQCTGRILSGQLYTDCTLIGGSFAPSPPAGVYGVVIGASCRSSSCPWSLQSRTAVSHGPELKTIKRRREFTPRRNELVHEVACWRCHQQRLVHVPGQPSAECRCGECCIVSRMSLSVSLRARHNRALRFQIGNRYTGQGRTARAKLRSSDRHTVLI